MRSKAWVWVQISELHSLLVWPCATPLSWDSISSSVNECRSPYGGGRLWGRSETFLCPAWISPDTWKMLLAASFQVSQISVQQLPLPKPFTDSLPNRERHPPPHPTDLFHEASFSLSGCPCVFRFFGCLFQGWQSLRCVRRLLPPPPRSHPWKKSISVSRSRWNRHISSPMEYSPSCFSTPHSPSSSPLSSKKLPHLCPHRQQQEVGVWCQGTLLNTEACPLALTFSKAWLLSCALLGQGGGSREQPCIFPFIFPGTLKWAT